jgi:RNA polymerase sigma-70 factor (ECF subfamily)
MVSLLTDDVRFTMPPLPVEFVGLERAAQFLAIVAAPPGHPYRLRWTRANGQPACAPYLQDARTSAFHAMGLLVVTLAGGRIRAMTRFESSVLGRFGLPRTLGA